VLYRESVIGTALAAVLMASSGPSFLAAYWGAWQDAASVSGSIPGKKEPNMAAKKTSKKATKTTNKKMAHKTKPKIARKTKAKSYSLQTGRPTGRELQALQRLDTLTKKYQADGISPQDARQRALDELRNDPRRDWRKG
jgi:hypothetical protein